MDVIQLINSGLPVRQGSAIIAVDRMGNYQALRPTIEEGVPVSGYFGVTGSPLDDRFDDYQYYST